jgi:hypothetical protein
MRSLIVPDPPVAIPGHPIELLELDRAVGSFLWRVKLRIATSTGPVETWQRYDAGKRITIDTIPESEEAYGLLLASRGDDPWSGNPPSDAIEALAARP